MQTKHSSSCLEHTHLPSVVDTAHPSRRHPRQPVSQYDTHGRHAAHIHSDAHTLCYTDTLTYLLTCYKHTHTHPFNGPFSGTTQVSRYQKGKTNLDSTEARDSEWQWHQLGHMQVCTLLQTDNHASTPPLSFLQAGCPSCHPTNSVKALKAKTASKHLHATQTVEVSNIYHVNLG